MNNIEIVNALWSRFDCGDYHGSVPLLHEKVQVIWPTSRELYDNRDKFIAVNLAFGSAWRFEVKTIEETISGKVISIVFVSSPDCKDSFYATSVFTLNDKKIVQIETYWAFLDQQPEWRNALSAVY